MTEREERLARTKMREWKSDQRTIGTGELVEMFPQVKTREWFISLRETERNGDFLAARAVVYRINKIWESDNISDEKSVDYVVSPEEYLMAWRVLVLLKDNRRLLEAFEVRKAYPGLEIYWTRENNQKISYICDGDGVYTVSFFDWRTEEVYEAERCATLISMNCQDVTLIPRSESRNDRNPEIFAAEA